MSKELLLQECRDAFERLIETAARTAQRGGGKSHTQGGWGPREVVAHMAGWEAMAGVRISQVVAGTRPFEFHETPQGNDAINAMIVTVVGEQPLDALCAILRRTYLRNLELLATLDEGRFHPGEYVYERTKSVIEHCEEHMRQLAS